MYKNHTPHYRAKAGQKSYEENRLRCGRTYDFLNKSEFIDYVTPHFFDDNWSLDACFGKALQEGSFSRKEMVCTKTLYNYVSSELLRIKNHNLFQYEYLSSAKRFEYLTHHFILLAGTPAITDPEGKLFVTTELVPIIQLSPMVIFPNNLAPP